MEKGCYKGPELTMSELGLSLEELAGQPLEQEPMIEILRGSTGCLKGLTEMAEGYRIWLNQISTRLWDAAF